jgi:hypothetical protein
MIKHKIDRATVLFTTLLLVGSVLVLFLVWCGPYWRSARFFSPHKKNIEETQRAAVYNIYQQKVRLVLNQYLSTRSVYDLKDEKATGEAWRNLIKETRSKLLELVVPAESMPNHLQLVLLLNQLEEKLNSEKITEAYPLEMDIIKLFDRL